MLSSSTANAVPLPRWGRLTISRIARVCIHSRFF